MEIAEVKLPGVYFDKVTFDALAKDIVTDYTVNGRDTLRRVKWSVDCLKESFGGMRAMDITTDRKGFLEIEEYQALKSALPPYLSPWKLLKTKRPWPDSNGRPAD